MCVCVCVCVCVLACRHDVQLIGHYNSDQLAVRMQGAEAAREISMDMRERGGIC